VRIAHRIRDLQALPYAVVMQEGVTKVYEVRRTTHDQLVDITSLFADSCTGPHLRSMPDPPPNDKLNIGNRVLQVLSISPNRNIRRQ
jgi:hypothetical protein